MYGDSSSVQMAWSKVRQERFQSDRISEGSLISWGTGHYGELGLGRYVTYTPCPMPLVSLRNTIITKVASGANHVLAIDSAGQVYSWGRGAGGRLGHGDFENRYQPELVKFYHGVTAVHVAAGDAHSAVLANARVGVHDLKISTFGRGAHGRLGNGTNRNSCLPILVRKFPPSVQGIEFFQVACGGAHTMAVGWVQVKKGIANPYGYQTFVLTWGYGTNGQLGTGYSADSFVPVRARLPKCDVIVEISAGRSWSVARTVDGSVYTWGKGLRGQLGQGEHQFSLVPRKTLPCYMSFVKIAAGYSHNVCISVTTKYLTQDKTEALAKRGNFNPFRPVIDLTLKKKQSASLAAIHCCRRNKVPCTETARAAMDKRFYCYTCGIENVCLDCIRICHRRHNVVETDRASFQPVQDSRLYRYSTEYQVVKFNSHEPQLRRHKMELSEKTKAIILKDAPKKTEGKDKKKKKVKHAAAAGGKGGGNKENMTSPNKPEHHQGNAPGAANQLQVKTAPAPAPVAKTVLPPLTACRCGLYFQFCRMIPEIPEDASERSDKERGDVALRRQQAAAHVLQNIARRYLYRLKQLKAQVDLALIRRQVCTAHYHANILQPIWSKLHRVLAHFNEERELQQMQIEDEVTRKFGYYYNLQSSMIAIDAMWFGVRKYVGDIAPSVPRITSAVERMPEYTEEMLELLRKTETPAKTGRSTTASAFSTARRATTTSKTTRKASTAKGGREEKLPEFGSLYREVALRSDDKRDCTWAFTWRSIRQQQLKLHPLHRVPVSELAMLTEFIPRERIGKFREGVYSDVDLFNCFVRRFIQDFKTENWRDRVIALKKAEAEAARRRAARDLERLKAKRFAGKNAIKEAEQIRNQQIHQAAGGDDANPVTPKMELMEQRLKLKLQQKRQTMEERQLTLRQSDQPFGLESASRFPIYRKRRHTLLNPQQLNRRMIAMKESIQRSNYIKRRNSLPEKITNLYVNEQPPNVVMLKSIKQSLEMFHGRFKMLEGMLRVFNRLENDWDFAMSRPRGLDCWKLMQLIKTPFLNPRLPSEINDLLVHGQRRRTIAEPERLAKQLEIMVDIREKYVSCSDLAREKYEIKRKRRSIDFGETRDRQKGIDRILGFEFEGPKESLTVTSLNRDSTYMMYRMAEAGYADHSADSAKLLEAKRFNRGGLTRQSTSGSVLSLARDKKVNAKSVSGMRNSSEKYSGGGFDDGADGRPQSVLSSKSNDISSRLQPPSRRKAANAPQLVVEVWQEHYTDEGQAYYFNPLSGVSTWEMPQGNNSSLVVQIEIQYQAEDGYWYWYNNTTGESRYIEY